MNNTQKTVLSPNGSEHIKVGKTLRAYSMVIALVVIAVLFHFLTDGLIFTAMNLTNLILLLGRNTDVAVSLCFNLHSPPNCQKAKSVLDYTNLKWRYIANSFLWLSASDRVSPSGYAMVTLPL